MTMRWIVPAATVVALGSLGLPAQSAPLGLDTAPALEQSAIQQTHYGYRHYRYYRNPGVYFDYGPRYHRYWRHHRHWR
jgi:hypothetical protein